MDVIVDEKQLAQAIGRGGQNVRLASELTGWTLNVMTEEAAQEKGASEATKTIQQFMQSLDVDENVATVLVQEGFTSLDEVAYVPKQELLGIEELDEQLVDELRNRARDVLLTKAIAQEEKLSLAQPERRTCWKWKAWTKTPRTDSPPPTSRRARNWPSRRWTTCSRSKA